MTLEVQSNSFIALADIALQNQDLQHAIGEGTRTAYYRRLDTMFAHSDEHGESMRQQAAEAKRRALRELPDLLEKAEHNLKKNGYQVEWAEDAAQANQLVLDIARRHQVSRRSPRARACSAKSWVTNHAMEAAGLRVVETDLGEYIIQLNGRDAEPYRRVRSCIRQKTEIRDISSCGNWACRPPMTPKPWSPSRARCCVRSSSMRRDGHLRRATSSSPRPALLAW